MDESLRNRAREVFEKDQKQLDDAFEPSSDVKAVGIVSSITITENADGTYTKTVKEEKAEDLYFDDSVVGKAENQIKEDAETLQEFCKEFDDQIISYNAEINAKKQEIVTLSAEALERNCWSGIVYTATTTGGVIASTGVGATTENVGNYTLIEDRDALEIYKKMAGPNLDYGAENPFDPTSIVTLTSSYSGFGHENIRDNGKTVSSDNTTEVSADDYNVGGGGDGSKEYLTNFETSPTVGSGQNVSSTSSNHIGPRNVGPFSAYAGVGVAPYATNTSLTGTACANKCVAIANSISTLSSEITSLRTQRDAAVNRSNLNKVKEKKMEKELQNWGSNNVKSKQTQRKTSNADVISAVDAMI